MIPPMQPNKSMSSLDGFRSNYSEPRWNKQRRACRCILATICLLSVGVLAVGAAVVVRQYAESRSYEAATCWLLNVTYGDDSECNHCTGTVEKGSGVVAGGAVVVDRDRAPTSSQHCFDVKFPCAKIIVEFTAKNPGRYRGRGLLYSDTAHASGEFPECSYSVCFATREENVRSINEFVERYQSAANQPFDCYYDTETADNVVNHKVYTRTDVIHCMLWPSLVLVACFIVFIYLEFERRRSIATYKDNSHGVRLQQQQPSHHYADRSMSLNSSSTSPQVLMPHDRRRPTA